MFDFPNTPSDGEVVIHPNGRTYEFNATRDSWTVVRDDLSTLTTRINALDQLNFLILE